MVTTSRIDHNEVQQRALFGDATCSFKTSFSNDASVLNRTRLLNNAIALNRHRVLHSDQALVRNRFRRGAQKAVSVQRDCDGQTPESELANSVVVI